MARSIQELNVTIPSGSSAVDFALQNCAWGSIQLPSAITGTTLSFGFSNDGSNFTTVPAEGNEANPVATGDVVASSTHALPYKTFSAKHCRINMATQTADRVIKVFLRD